MNGEEAAKKLGISVRSLQRAVGREALHVTYKRGRSGKQEAVYDPEEVARYKAELEEEGTKPPATPPTNGDNKALARVSEHTKLTGLVELIRTVTEQQPQAPPRVPLNTKFYLTIEEAGVLSGISEGALLEAIHRQDLKAVLNKLGRGYRVKRTHLEDFAESFDNEE
jgi:excisionase family DNA binding protein